MSAHQMTPGDRRELRSLVKRQFAVLRADVKRRAQELEAEIESELVRRYRQQDERIEQARREMDKATLDYQAACSQIMEALRAVEPDLRIGKDFRGNLAAVDERRTATHRALIASIPQQIADASSKLDQQELDLLRELTVDALDSEQAKRFLGSIPTVGELVPKARLAEIEGAS